MIQVYVGNEKYLTKVATLDVHFSVSKSVKELMAQTIGEKMAEHCGYTDWHAWYDAEEMPSEMWNNQ